MSTAFFSSSAVFATFFLARSRRAAALSRLAPKVMAPLRATRSASMSSWTACSVASDAFRPRSATICSSSMRMRWFRAASSDTFGCAFPAALARCCAVLSGDGDGEGDTTRKTLGYEHARQRERWT